MPKQFRTTKVLYNSITLSWDPHPIVSREGPILYYDLQYTGNGVRRNLTLPVHKRSCELDGLVHNTRYTIKLRAVSPVGKGWWATLQATTKELGMESSFWNYFQYLKIFFQLNVFLA